MRLPAFLLILISGLLALTACGDQSAPDKPLPSGETELADPVPPTPLVYEAPPVNAVDTAGSLALPAGSVNFAGHIAPIVFNKCSSCHRPGESAPFSFLNYRQIKARARQIAEVTRSRYMPPWAPTHGYVDYVGERSLSEREIAAFQRWYEDGCPEGDPASVPAVPARRQGWQLGEPDLIVEMAEPFTVPAEGRDVFQTFVIPTGILSDRYVRAIEIRPDNLSVAHHGILAVDETSTCRNAAAATPEPGYEGMNFLTAKNPTGYFVGWTPGKRPTMSLSGMPWVLKRNSDLVLQMHLITTGKTESFSAKIGLYFTSQPPKRTPFSLLLRNDAIDIPAGADTYEIEDSFVLPAPVKVLSIYPHAHYIGKQFRVFAIHPDGRKTWLFYADDWDFNWQDSYEYKDKIELESGTRIVVQIDYDNSEENPRNPTLPPTRVRYGLQSTDEMGTCSITVLPKGKNGMHALRISLAEKRADKYPDIWTSYLVLGRAYAFANRTEKAIEAFKKGLELFDNILFHKQIASTLARAGKEKESLPYFLKAAPGHMNDGRFLFDYALALYRCNQRKEAIQRLEHAVTREPTYAPSYILSATILKELGQVAGVFKVLKMGCEARPDHLELHRMLRSACRNAADKKVAAGIIRKSAQIAAANGEQQLAGQLRNLAGNLRN